MTIDTRIGLFRHSIFFLWSSTHSLHIPSDYISNLSSCAYTLSEKKLSDKFINVRSDTDPPPFT